MQKERDVQFPLEITGDYSLTTSNLANTLVLDSHTAQRAIEDLLDATCDVATHQAHKSNYAPKARLKSIPPAISFAHTHSGFATESLLQPTS